MKSQSKRCIAYVRVSSDGQRDNYSLETQRESCVEIAELQGCTMVDIVEEVYTGTMLERPKLTGVRNRIANGEEEVVLVYDQDRLSRNQRQTNRLIDGLDEAGAEIWSVRQR